MRVERNAVRRNALIQVKYWWSSKDKNSTCNRKLPLNINKKQPNNQKFSMYAWAIILVYGNLRYWWLDFTKFTSISFKHSDFLPIGLGTECAYLQSYGRPLSDQITGCSLSLTLREMATILHVSCRTAIRLQRTVMLTNRQIVNLNIMNTVGKYSPSPSP